VVIVRRYYTVSGGGRKHSCVIIQSSSIVSPDLGRAMQWLRSPYCFHPSWPSPYTNPVVVRGRRPGGFE